MIDVMVASVPVTNVHAAVTRHFHEFVHQVIVARRENVQRPLEESHLLGSSALRNQDNRARVNVELGILLQEVPAIVSNDNVVVGYREPDEIPVLPTSLSQMRNVVSLIAMSFGNPDQSARQALVDQKPFLQWPRAAESADRQSAPKVASAQRMTASIPSTGRLG